MIDKTTKKSLGFGFITLSEQNKIKEILNSQPHFIKGKEIECQEFPSENKFKFLKKNHEHKHLHDSNFQSKKIFIGGLPPQTTKNTLINFFKRYGEIEYCVINTDKYTDKPRGFGFIVFQSPLSVDYCLKDTNNHFILGKWVECKRANARENNKKKFVEKSTYPTYENGFFLRKQKMKLQNNLRSFITSKYYPQPYYINQGHQQINLFIYQDNESNKNKNIKKNNNNNIIFNNSNHNLISPNESPPLSFQKFKEKFKSNSIISNINNEQIINEIETNSSTNNSSGNNNSNSNLGNSNSFYINNNNKKNEKDDNDFYNKIQDEKEDENEINTDSKNLNQFNKSPFINKNNYNKIKKNFPIIIKNTPYHNVSNENENDWSLQNLISNQTKEMFQNYFNNTLKNPKEYNYFHYKLFDVNGEEISKLSSYQNISKVKLFKSDNETSKSDKDSDSNSNTNSNYSKKKYSILNKNNNSDSNSNNSDKSSKSENKSSSDNSNGSNSNCNSGSNHYSSSNDNKTPSQNSNNSNVICNSKGKKKSKINKLSKSFDSISSLSAGLKIKDNLE